MHGLRCDGNITRTRNVSEYMLVLALCLVRLNFSCRIEASRRHFPDSDMCVPVQLLQLDKFRALFGSRINLLFSFILLPDVFISNEIMI